ncbi:MAG: hypothetical protein N2449_04325 [Bacteroidales bacterium]|nr:hypothetical protein [Bacteroidales bacterium]
MKYKFFPALSLILLLLWQCTSNKNNLEKTSTITESMIVNIIDTLKTISSIPESLIEKGVKQASLLWDSSDGSPEEFKQFCIDHIARNEQAKQQLFDILSQNFEILNGYFNKIMVELMKPLHLTGRDILPIDELFGGYNPSAHVIDDFFANKIAFITILNFPSFTLKEKSELGKNWTRQEWAYARIGDIFTSRVPANLLQNFNQIVTKADTYISEYNIFMGNVQSNNQQYLFPKDMKLITHWGLRDELKSNYANKEQGLIKQQTIYQIMKHIIAQDIPKEVINNPNVQWNPFTNEVYSNNNKIQTTAEPNTRYQHMLNIFNAIRLIDKYNPQYPTYIQRKFESEMEIPQEEVERMFVEFVSSPQMKAIGELISKRLGRPLEPFDIWYDGFKPRSNISETTLSDKTRKLFPNTQAFQNHLPVILTKLGFEKQSAQEISSRITVDASRGAGHAWGSEMRGDNARLRTRINENGMDYKGYNIAMHEFGHNVEQTLSLYNVDYYMLRGVPNTAFTEALAFIFQKRDLFILDMKDENALREHFMALDNAWATYEIMGVSLVDMRVWKWLYQNPNATAEELKQQVINTAIDVWNEYYAPVFGKKDEPILAIYSHMIDAPLYLSAYPLGHIIEFQIEQHLKNKSFASEVQRIYTLGRLTPNIWMINAVGTPISTKPMLDAVTEALKVVK